MAPVSVVIVCRNEADVIARTLQSLQGVSDDIIVYDNGSTDGTMEIVKQFPVQLHQGSWEGFGKTKNKANALARHEWILSLDADEAIDSELKENLLRFDATDTGCVYDISFKSFLGNKQVRYGEWGGDHHIRLFNRRQVNWNEAPVHEELLLPENCRVKKISGNVLHYSMADIRDYGTKMLQYAMLNAEKYYHRGKKAGWVKLRLSPAFTFFHYYILKLGFLDGHEGYLCAKMTAYYTFMKYARLRELHAAGSV